MPLCEVCQSIDLRSLLESFRTEDALKAPEGPVVGFLPGSITELCIKYGQQHRDSFVALRKAAEDGCDFCGIVWVHHGTMPYRLDHREDCPCSQYPGPVRLVVVQGTQVQFPRLAVVVMPADYGQERVDGYDAAQLELCTAKGAQLPLEDWSLLDCLAKDEAPSDLGSELCLCIGKDWLDRCLREHSECLAKQQSRQAILPTRVINVGTTSTNPFLYESSSCGEIGKWVALSYCWGGDSPLILNKASLTRLREGLPLSDFPPTLRDAIIVTRALSVEYLWIDCLCIFQDDQNDWATEASRMSDVYQNAILTIAIKSAPSVLTGFLDKRRSHFNCALPWLSKNASSSSLYIQNNPIFVRWPYEERNIPPSLWEKRGWTFQEQLLPLRLLTYTTGRMEWKCYVAVTEESQHYRIYRDNLWYYDAIGSLFWKLKDVPVESSSSQYSAVKDSVTMPDELWENTVTIYQLWYELVANYSERTLTFDTDCLPAVAGFAKRFQGFLKDEYCAGLWRGDLLYGLLWVANPNRPKRCDEQKVREVLSKDTQPSWSWVRAFSIGVKWPHRGLTTFLANITDVQTNRLDRNELGSDHSAALVLEAPYHHLDLRLEDDIAPPWNLQKLAQALLTMPGSLPRLINLGTSCSTVIPRTDTVKRFTFVQIMREHGSQSTIYLLLLEHLAPPGETVQGTYRRVGSTSLQPLLQQFEILLAPNSAERLEDAAYNEVINEDWPRGSFTIV